VRSGLKKGRVHKETDSNKGGMGDVEGLFLVVTTVVCVVGCGGVGER